MHGTGKSEDVIRKILQIKDKCLCVRGNREKYIIEGMPQVVHDEKVKISQKQLDRHEWIKNNLSDMSKKFIASLPLEMNLEVDGKKIYCVHYPINKNKKFKKHIKIANLKENEEMFADINADIFLYGHTHVNIYNKSNDKYYINPGALGCPGKTNEAPYGILEIYNNKVKYKQLNAIYNVKKVVKNIKEISFPGYEDVLKIFYGTELPITDEKINKD